MSTAGSPTARVTHRTLTHRASADNPATTRSRFRIQVAGPSSWKSPLQPRRRSPPPLCGQGTPWCTTVSRPAPVSIATEENTCQVFIVNELHRKAKHVQVRSFYPYCQWRCLSYALMNDLIYYFNVFHFDVARDRIWWLRRPPTALELKHKAKILF